MRISILLFLFVFLVGCSKGEPAVQKPSGPAKATAPLSKEDGLQLYVRACASCHGNKGGGDGHRSRMIGPLPNFTTAEFHTSRTDAQLRAAITKGKGSMPAFEFRFGEHETTALVAVVRSFAPTP